MTGDVRDKIAQIDEELIQLLAERRALCQEAQEEDPDILGDEAQTDVHAQWDEAADEHGWNPPILARICKAIIDLCRSAD